MPHGGFSCFLLKYSLIMLGFRDLNFLAHGEQCLLSHYIGTNEVSEGKRDI